ncbi:MAG: hypothetical protein ABSF69_11235 [Polyangiaceae bacterium]|jgi:hypothetical protein
MTREPPVNEAAEMPRIVFEGRESCPSAERTHARLDRALAGTRAPSRGWVVTIRVEEPAPQALDAQGDISDETGRPIAHRTLAGAAGDCDGLVQAMGVWASLVLDLEREHPRPGPWPISTSETSNALLTETAPSPTIARPSAGSKAPHPDAAPPDGVGGLREEAQALEIGLGTLLMTGTGANAMLGITPSLVIETTAAFVVRPALVVGESLTPLGGSGNATWAAARVDGCSRLPGLYDRDRGLQLDLCGGAEAGFTHFAGPPSGSTGSAVPASPTTLPQLAIGPSIDLRGELGNRLSVLLRGVAEINAIRSGFEQPASSRVNVPWFAARIEVALSWRVR